jgi:competence protein CoiA
MHLFAVDSSGKLMEAKQASKQQDYYCLECRGVVRRRSGIHRTAHFFHLNSPDACRQQGKSLTHLQLQYTLQSLLPPGEVILEHPFPTVKRIADVAWIPRKIIFEIQCSPISPDEIEGRQQDYLSQGFHVVWILHDRRYNQQRLSAAEHFLQPFPHYFTSIDADGKGLIYDQFSIFQKGMRKHKGKVLEINPSKPLHFQDEKGIPSSHPRSQWPFYFEGDCIHQKLQGVAEMLDGFEEAQTAYSYVSQLKFWMIKIRYYLLRPYELIFKFLLEKACK